MNSDVEIIIGIHSIVEALKNTQRVKKCLYITEDSFKEIRKKTSFDFKTIIVKKISNHQVQEKAKSLFNDLGFNYSRVPSGAILLCESIGVQSVKWLYDLAEKKEVLKVIALDQVTDIYNSGAILRTAAFYNVDAMIISSKGSFGITPGFSRISSGSLEYVPIVQCNNLSKTLLKLKERAVRVVGFSEHSEVDVRSLESSKKNCVVIGSEDAGLSNSVSRVIESNVCLTSQSKIKSLNASVAAALAMNYFFANSN